MTTNRARMAALLPIACWALLAVPAAAQRGIVIDQPPLYDPGVCTLGNASCVGFALNNVSDRFSRVFVYNEGILSFGAPLSAGASLAGGPGTFGDVSWFAPGFGSTQYQARVSYTDFGFGPSPLINFFAPGDPIAPQVFDDPETEDVDEFKPASLPVMQVQLYTSSSKYQAPYDNPYSYSGDPNWEDATIGFGYGTGFAPDAGALIGFRAQGSVQSVTNSNGLLIGQSNFAVVLPGLEAIETEVVDPETGDISYDVQFVYPNAVSQFNIVRSAIVPPAGVPEPAAWAMMILGFGIIGSAARGSRRRIGTSPRPV